MLSERSWTVEADGGRQAAAIVDILQQIVHVRYERRRAL